jgi:poly(A) polymerase
MSEAGVLLAVLGGVPRLASFANVTKLEHELSLVPDPVRRLGALAVSTTEDAERLRERLRLANAEYDRLASMGDRWWQISATADMHDARVLIYRLGPDKFLDRVLLAWSRSWTEGVADDHWHDLALLPGRWTAPVFPLKAADFIGRGIAKGPALGAALRAAEAAWIAEDFPMDAKAVERIAEAAVRA